MSKIDKTILVVDDEELLRNAIIFQFKREGFNVLSACNGIEAFEIIKNNHVDAVVSDVQMPGGNGIDLLKSVKEFNANIPVLVFITAFADITESEAYDLGAHAIFSKPFDRKALVSCIKKSVNYDGCNWKSEAGEETLSGKKIISDTIVPIGRGGAFVHTDKSEFNVGEIIEIEVGANFGGVSSVKLKGVGKVKWTRYSSENLPTGIGVEFVSLMPDTHKDYEQWLIENKIKPYIPLKAAG